MNLLLMMLLLAAPPQSEWIGQAPTKITRMVSLAPNLTELVFELGHGNKIVGVTQFDNYPPAVVQLPRVGGFINPNVEAIMATQPDIVLTTPNSGGKTVANSLARLGIPVLSVPAQQWNHLYPAISTLADLLGSPHKGTQLINNLRKQEASLGRKFAHLPITKALVVLGLRPLVCAGPTSFIDRFLPLTRIHNVVARGGPYPVLSAESVWSLKPSLIIDLSMSPENVSQTFWSNYPQKKGLQIRRFADDALLRLGPRIFKALEKLADEIHQTKKQ